MELTPFEMMVSFVMVDWMFSDGKVFVDYAELLHF